MDIQPSSRQVELLLQELCVVLGFCLPPEVNARLMREPPTDVDEFTDAVIRAEGLDPYADIPLHLRRDVRARVVKHFGQARDG
jgi:hypothetical protein